MTKARVRKKGKARRAIKRRPLAHRFCASPVCPYGLNGSPRVFTPTRVNHTFCSPECASYERLKRWRLENPGWRFQQTTSKKKKEKKKEVTLVQN
jgi:hypothetical protein